MSGTATRAVEVPCPGILLENAVQEAQCQVLETQRQNVSLFFLKIGHCILSRASEVGSLMNHLGSAQRLDTDQGPFSPLTGGLEYLDKVNLMTDHLKFKNTDRLWTGFTNAG